MRPPQPPTILIVDDEEIVLNSLRALLAVESDYKVLTFTDPLLAIQETKGTPVDVVISDYLMPKMTGMEFLGEVRRLQPEAIRILLTGFADKENAIRAINTVGLYQYLEKPWDNEGLLLILQNGLSEKSLRRQLAEKLKVLDELLSEHQKLEQRHSDLEQELQLAARVQRSLFPTTFPQIEGFRIDGFYRPCRTIGGDYYDYCAAKERTIFLVSDVSGHGIQASLASMLLKAIFQDAAQQAVAPVELLKEMNARLHRFLPEGMFAAATVGWVSNQDGHIQLASAGLPYPFVLSGSGRRLDEIALGGTPLGILDDIRLSCFDVRDVQMASGDVLLIASDGLHEIHGANDEFFQDRQLRQVLGELKGQQGSQVIQGLMERADRFGGGKPPHDDISIVAITKL